MKSGERPKPVRGLRQDTRRFRLLVFVAGFFLVSLTFVLLSRPDAILFSMNGKLPVDQAPTSILIRQKVNPPPATSRKTSTDALPGGDPRVVDDDGKSKGTSKHEEEESRVLSEPDPTSGMTEPTGGSDDEAKTLSVGGGDGEKKGTAPKGRKVALPTVSNYTIHDADDTEPAKQDGNDVPTHPGHPNSYMTNYVCFFQLRCSIGSMCQNTRTSTSSRNRYLPSKPTDA